MNNSRANNRVYISYGFAEGAKIGRSLVEALSSCGYEVVDDPHDATCIIAHSGGCYIVPTNRQFDTALLVDVTYWPERPFLGRIITKLRRDGAHMRKQYGFMQWLRKSALGAGYAIMQPKRAHDMHTAMAGSKLPRIDAKRIIVIRNQHDPWLSQTFHEVFTRPEATFVSLPGEHDDIWENPARYVGMIRI